MFLFKIICLLKIGFYVKKFSFIRKRISKKHTPPQKFFIYPLSFLKIYIIPLYFLRFELLLDSRIRYIRVPRLKRVVVKTKQIKKLLRKKKKNN